MKTKPMPQITARQEFNFWEKVDRRGPTMPHMTTPCWTWTAFKSGGYGQFGIGRGNIFKAHRIAFAQSGGKLTEDKPYALHRCDNPSCCNPDHIWAGTDQDNATDKANKGRCNPARGERNGKYTKPECTPRGSTNGNSKLTAEKVLEIRARYANGGISQTKLARDFGVAQTLISHIIRRTIWNHVA